MIVTETVFIVQLKKKKTLTNDPDFVHTSHICYSEQRIFFMPVFNENS